MGGVLLGLLVQLGIGPRLPSPSRRRRERGEKRRKEGGAAPSPCPIRTGQGGGGATSGRHSLFSTKAHCGPLIPRGVPVTSRYSEKYPIHFGTIPVSEYNLPIYQCLCLDHFETPRHVRDHIRDSEQPSVHQNI